jgi:N4-gp56 family major capsid protein
MGMQYNTGGTTSSIGASQFNEHYYAKQALIEARKTQYFMQLADVTSMPKNMGKKIKRYHYIPLLDDANINDQGLDATGATIANGNLYGSSKDIGAIPSKLPVLSETGGRVNRVGFKRKELEGTFEKFGYFSEYTQDSLDFDTDAELMQHINRELVNAAHEITEDSLQIDLINAAGVIKYAGAAVSNATVDATCLVSYSDLMHLAIDLDNNRTPKHTKIITGTRMVDTKVLPASRVLYVGSELLPTLQAMKDLHNERAFIPVEKYAAGGTVLNGEAGAVDRFRVVVVPEMMKWAGAGADATADADNYKTGTKFDVFPMLCIGNESFTTIGFQTDGKTVKFKIFHKKPGEATADRNDPYGETGFMSIKWFYGFMALRPERIGLVKTVARL